MVAKKTSLKKNNLVLDIGVSDDTLLKKSKKNIDIQKKKLQTYFNEIKLNSIARYGASATSNTLISYFKISKFFKYLIDDNPAKIGLHSPGYHLPVFEEKIFKSNPPEVVTILALRYKDNILKKLKLLKEKYKLKKLLVIVPLPDIKFSIYNYC
jgi:hypothetical protein